MTSSALAGKGLRLSSIGVTPLIVVRFSKFDRLNGITFSRLSVGLRKKLLPIEMADGKDVTTTFFDPNSTLGRSIVSFLVPTCRGRRDLHFVHGVHTDPTNGFGVTANYWFFLPGSYPLTYRSAAKKSIGPG